ncbi:MAG: phosphate uptake regulator PhoU [Candidatus Woesearchaeota archaeon]|jgi:phosphate uptake regulator
MKRKIIQLAGTTFVVSLPLKWIRQMNVKKGDEVNLEIKGNSAILKLGSNDSERKSKEIDVSGMGQKPIQKMIAAAYKIGYDDLIIKFRTSNELEMIHTYLNGGLIGFEIVEEKNNVVKASCITKVDEEEFNIMLKRAFLFIINLGEDLVNIQNKQEMEKIILRDSSINRIMDFCRRTVNKNPDSRERSTVLYYIMEELERIGDLYCEIAEEIMNSKNKNILPEINAYFRDFYNLFYKFDLDCVKSFLERKKPLLKKIKYFHKIDYLCEQLIKKIYDLNGPLMMLNL